MSLFLSLALSSWLQDTLLYQYFVDVISYILFLKTAIGERGERGLVGGPGGLGIPGKPGERGASCITTSLENKYLIICFPTVLGWIKII